METKARLGWGVLRILGMVYAILGAGFLALGILLSFMPDRDGMLFGLIFGGIGSIFLLLGLAFLLTELRRKRRAQRLVDAGRYLWAQVVEITVQHNVTINGSHPCAVLACYTAPDAVRHMFKSANVRMFRDQSLIGRQVKVSVMCTEQRKRSCKPSLSELFALFRCKIFPPFSEKILHLFG